MYKAALSKLRSVRFLKFAPLFLVVALGAWAYASPMGSSPDDNFHLTSIWCGQASPDAICAEGDSAVTRTVPAILLEAPCYAYKPELSAECIEKIGYSVEPTVLTDVGNFAGGYPPLFYAVMNLFAGTDVQVSILIMRFVNILLLTALMTATFLALPIRRRGILVWSWLLTSVPLGLFFLASNNPSSWAMIGVGISWIAFLGFLETEGRRKVVLGVLSILAVVIAAGARADGAIYSLIGIAAVLVIKFRRSLFTWKTAVVVGVAVIVCALFYLTSTQAVSAINGFGNPGAPIVGPGGSPGDVSTESPSIIALLAFNILNAPMLWEGAFGSWGLGWMDTELPSIVYLGSMAAFVSVAFIGFGNLNRKKFLALAAIGAALWILPVYVLTMGGSHVGIEVQPRYLLPLIILFAGVLLVKVRDRSFVLTRGQAYLVALTLSLANFVALHFTMRRFITGIDVMGWNLNEGIEWWWQGFMSPMALLIIGSLSFALLAFVIAREINLDGSRKMAPSRPLAKAVHE